MFISNVKRESLAMELLEIAVARVVNKHKLASVGDEPYEEGICIKPYVMVTTHEQAIARLVFGVLFGLRRNPMAVLEVFPNFWL